jgi:hypothetical protein
VVPSCGDERVGDVQRRDEQVDGGEEAQQPAGLVPGLGAAASSLTHGSDSQTDTPSQAAAAWAATDFAVTET